MSSLSNGAGATAAEELLTVVGTMASGSGQLIDVDGLTLTSSAFVSMALSSLLSSPPLAEEAVAGSVLVLLRVAITAVNCSLHTHQQYNYLFV